MDSQSNSCFEIRKEGTEAEHLFHPVETKGGRKFRFQYQAWQVGPFWSHRRTILDAFAEGRCPSLWSLLWSLMVERFLPSTGLILLVTVDFCQSALLGLDAL